MIDFVGDICLANGSKIPILNKENNFNFPIVPAEMVIGNLECVFVEEENFDSDNFNFGCMEDRADILNSLGINCVSLANNHIMDCGKEGLVTTMGVLNKNSISFFGAGLNSKEANLPFIVSSKGKEYAFLGRLEADSFETLGETIATENKPGVAALDMGELRKSVESLKLKGVDYIVLCVHWGVQEVRRAHPRIHRKARVLIEDIGVDLIIGNHSHCIQGALKISNKDVFFGLGNFFFLPYQFQGDTLYDGTEKLNSESLIVRVEEVALKSASYVVCQRIDSELELVMHDRQSYIVSQIYGKWASGTAGHYYMEYRIRGVLVELKKFSLIFTSRVHRKKLYFELSRPHLLLKRVFDMIFNPRHR